MRFTRVLALLSCLVASACGAASPEHPADEAGAVSAPPIEAIDEPADTDFGRIWANGDDGSSTEAYTCLDDTSTESDDACKPSPEEVEKLRRIGEEYEQAFRPAEGSQPRKIARLRLTARDPKAQAFLVAWRNRAGKLCLADSEEDEDGDRAGGGPFGPCIAGDHCDGICLTYSGNLVGMAWLNTVTGVFPARADLLRVTFDDGAVVSYKLNGPLVPGFPEYRAFILDVGRNIETRLELFQGDKLLAEEKRSHAEILMERCTRDFPVDDMPRTPAEAEKSPLAQCFERGRSE